MLNLDNGVEASLHQFLDLLKPIYDSGKLAAVLIQLPPSVGAYYDRLENFLKLLPKESPFAVEFKHRSWCDDETWRLLAKDSIANTIVDEPLLPPEPVVTADFAYVRWHGHGMNRWYNYRYSIDEL